MTADAGHPDWLTRARSSLRDADPVLARLIDDRPAFDPRAWLAELPAMDLFGGRLPTAAPPWPRTAGRATSER